MAQTSKSSQLIGVLGTILLVAAAYGLTQQDDAASAQTEPSKRLGALLVEGDADTPIDTIRRLQQNAKSAVDKAAQTDQKVERFAETTTSKLEALTELLTAIRDDSNDEIDTRVGSMKSEMQNWMQLMEGRMKQANTRDYRQQDGAALNTWVEIAPLNAHPMQFAQARRLQSDPAIAEYALNNGFLLNQTTDPATGDADNTEPQSIPVATIPVNSPLLNSMTLSTLIGRVPKGGQVFEPFNFYIQTGIDNWTSQDHDIPYLERAIWRGVATGDKDLECIRGALVSVTFVFTDETIQTVQGSREEPLAELVSTTGSNCVPGQYVSNTGKYIAMYGLGGGLAGLGQAISENETVSSFTASGSLIRSVNGDTGNFLAGKALSASAVKAAEIIDDEYQNSFSSVVLESGLTVNLMALRQIDIDYDPQGRKVRYYEAGQ